MIIITKNRKQDSTKVFITAFHGWKSKNKLKKPLHILNNQNLLTDNTISISTLKKQHTFSFMDKTSTK